MTYQLLRDLGIIAALGSMLIAVIKIAFSQIKGIKLGVKALLRAQMISEYNKAIERGFAPLYAKENFQNCWEQYHAIKGPNGVMDDIHKKYMAFPTEPPKQGGGTNGN